MLKNLLGIAPQAEPDGSFRPSKVALKLSTSDTTDFDDATYDRYRGNRSKILVIFTERKNMEMRNSKLFSTGNHPVEALVPMLHLERAGFTFQIVTPTGQPVVFEQWAFPEQDKHVRTLYRKHESDFQRPGSLAEFTSGASPAAAADYAAIFVPGGHGAMLGIPEDRHVAAALRWAHDNGLYTISLCHGPGAFLATKLDDRPFLYAGYRMAVFPDSVDNMTPLIGYLPGKMPRGLSEPLKDLGAEVVNSKADDTVCLDRRLITGASPLAANELGKLAATTLLENL